MSFPADGWVEQDPEVLWRTSLLAGREALDKAGLSGADIAAIGILVPYPGTETWELAIKGEGGYRKLSPDWRDYNKQLGIQ